MQRDEGLVAFSIVLGTDMDEAQPPSQAGFRSGYSTIDHMFVVQQLVEKYNEFNKLLFLGFVDYSKAFDSIEHPFIWQALKEQGVQHKYIRILKFIYDHSFTRIKIDNLSRRFKVAKGIKQGDPFSPKVFNSGLHKILSLSIGQERELPAIMKIYQS